MHSRINLLNPSTAVKSKASPEGVSRPLAAICLLFFVFSLGAYGGLFSMNSSLTRQKDQVLKDIAAKEALEQQLRSKGVLITEKGRLTSEIERLKSQRPVLSRYFDEMLPLVPPGLSLSNFRVKDNPLEATIKGQAGNHTLVAQFGRNLQESKSFGASLISSSFKQLTQNTIEFTITITPGPKGGTN